MPRRAHIVFEQRESAAFLTRPEIAVHGVFIDLDDLDHLVRDAVKNKSRKAKCGPVTVEIHSLKEASNG